jgi:hypothetical protein
MQMPGLPLLEAKLSATEARTLEARTLVEEIDHLRINLAPQFS